MGYESKIFLVRNSKILKDENGKCFGLVLAMFEMGKTSHFLSKVFKKPSPCYFYDPCDGNRKITHDAYDEECTYCETRDFYNCIMENHGDWAPWKVVAEAIRSIREGRPDCILIHYGH